MNAARRVDLGRRRLGTTAPVWGVLRSVRHFVKVMMLNYAARCDAMLRTFWPAAVPTCEAVSRALYANAQPSLQ